MSLETIVEDFDKLIVDTSIDSQTNPNPNPRNIETQNINKPSSSVLRPPILQNINMAFKPEYLNCVPIFDGNPSELNRYFATCESIISSFYDRQNPNNFLNIYILNSLVSKLSGNAKSVVNIQNCTNWEDLKKTLYRNFADQRDEACLNRDLVLMRQNHNESVNNFYDRVLSILNLLCSYVDIHETSQESKTLKRNLYSTLALKTFISGIKEPLGTTIRCMRPKTLEEAMQFLTDEENIQYFQNITNKNNFKFTSPQNQNQNNFGFQNRSQNNFTPMRNPLPNQNIFQPRHFSPYPNNNNNLQNRNFPSQPINIQPRYIQPRRLPTNSEVFGRQQRPQTNVFKPNQIKSMPPPTPMSTTTRQTNQNYNQPFKQYNAFQPPTNSPNPQPNRSTMYNTNVDIQPENFEIQSENVDYNESYFTNDPNFYEYQDEMYAQNNIQNYHENYVSEESNENFTEVPTIEEKI